MPTANSASAMPGAIVGFLLEGFSGTNSLYPLHFKHQRRPANLI
jgi:hypothetical protein